MTTSLDHKPLTGAEVPALEEERESRTRLYVLLAVLGVVVVGTAAWFLLLSGSDAETELVVTPSTAGSTVPSSTPTAVTPTPSPTDVPAAAPVDAAGVDPFDPLVVPPPTSAATAPTTGAMTGATTAPTSLPTTGPTTGATTTPTTAPKKTAKPKPTRTPVTLRMVAVAADNASATIQVNGKKHTVDTGESFGSEFTLVRLADGKCGTVKHETDYFDICEGQTVEH